MVSNAEHYIERYTYIIYIYIQREIDVLLCDQAMFESKSLGVVDFTGLGGI